MINQFVHLHVHSEFSLLDGIVRVDELIQSCKHKKMPAVAITDHCNLFAAVKFYQEAISAGIKPIIGAELLIENKENKKQPHRVILLCQNKQGYLNLISLISKAYLEGLTQGQPLANQNWLTVKNDGLIAILVARESDVAQALLSDNEALAKEQVTFWKKNFQDRFYFEITHTERVQEEVYIKQIIKFAHGQQVPLVATNAVRFLNQDDFDAHEARVCIHEGYVLEDSSRPRTYTDKQFLRSSHEMMLLFSEVPESIYNTIEIAKRCNLKLTLNEFFLPNFPTPKNISVDDYLKKEAIKGLESRFVENIENVTEEKKKIYDDRLSLELEMIIKMGFSGYFLIVADFIAWAKANNVPVGPGRGSGAGSLVAYALKITGLDPIAYDLLFERFLNPERVSLPDFDVDFCMDGRDRVIEYVVKTYGDESVAQIITFGTMAAKAVVRDVGRVLGLPYGFVDKVAKLIPFELGITLKKALEQEPILQQRYDTEEEVKTLIDLAKKLEGIARNAGKHAGGVVIAPSKISEFAPLYLENSEDQAVTQFDKDDIETIGLVKFDFLGLRTLTIIHWATKTINNEKNQDPIDIEKIPLDDSKTFSLLKSCSTTGVFQLESRGMKDLIKRLQPDCFEDIIALVALFRPGPLQSGMVDDFINRKHGLSKIEYLHPDLEPILRSTYGVILYQEQVMQIAQSLAGYTLGGADLLRRAMGKKKPEEMAKQRVIFIKGAEERGIARAISQAIFDLMEKFAGYGFNKSHSAAYAMVSYQTAWLKANYPAAFMAAVLSSDMDNTDKVSNFFSECRNMKLNVLAPNINKSEYKFTVTKTGEILYGLGAIKGLGESAIENIIVERSKNGAFEHLFDFCCRVDLRKVNRRALEALIKSGSLDSFGQERSVLFHSIEAATRLSEAQAKNHASGQFDLFSSVSKQQNTVEYVVARVWTMEERLNYEKETLGLYLSGNPLDQFSKELNQIIKAPIEQLILDKNQTILIAGIITQVRTMFTKRGDKMAFISLEDQSGKLELAVFSDVYDKARDLITKDQLVIIETEITITEGNDAYKASAKNVMTLDMVREGFAKYIQIIFDSSNASCLSKITECIAPFKYGKLPLMLLYKNENTKVNIETNKAWRVNPSNKLLAELSVLLGEDNVEVFYT